MTAHPSGALTSVTSPTPPVSLTPPVDERLAAVRRYEILDAEVDAVFDRVARLAAQVFDTPIGTVTIVDQDRIWFAAAEGLDGVSEIGADTGLCLSAIGQRGPYVIDDARLDPRTRDNPLVTGPLQLRFYAAVPIVTRDGHALGTVNAIDQKPGAATPAQLDVLSDLAGVIAEHLETRVAAIRAIRAEQELRQDADRRAEAAAVLAGQLQAASARLADRRPPSCCQLGGPDRCDRPAELKVADSWGDSAWGCIQHAEQALMAVSAVFVATEDLGGLAAYVARGRGPAF